MDTPRHTAQEVAEQVASGMEPDVELVAAQYYDAMKAERDDLKRKLDKIADWARLAADSPDTTFAQAGSGILSIVEGRDNG